ncbi:TetR/AcrR family transcriptional regulator [Actinokineospora pegani]|uniref:TetR/AcrR family transcriptional regulator n=1 Tax=Actinokineospora pegani TaxID=2654637 RepID=UPI0012EAC2E9|nr:TetR/AcrR family transcriptional regulator [Actinokineospora pegani]
MGTEGLRDRKKRQTRTTLVRAAVELATEHGYDNITTDDIATRAGVSTRTFFNYFATKEDAVLNPDPGADDRIRAHITTSPPDQHPLETARTFLHNELTTIDHDHKLWLARLSVIREHPDMLNRAFLSGAATEHTLAEAFADRLGLPADHTYPRTTAATITSAFRVALTQWLRTPGDPTTPALGDHINEVFTLLTHGLTPPARP